MNIWMEGESVQRGRGTERRIVWLSKSGHCSGAWLDMILVQHELGLELLGLKD